MNRVFAVVVMALVIALAVSAYAVPQEQKYTTKQVDRNGDGKLDGVDIYDESGNVVKRGYDTNNDNVVDRWEATDENTGMPVVVESDQSFELNPSY